MTSLSPDIIGRCPAASSGGDQLEGNTAIRLRANMPIVLPITKRTDLSRAVIMSIMFAVSNYASTPTILSLYRENSMLVNISRRIAKMGINTRRVIPTCIKANATAELVVEKHCGDSKGLQKAGRSVRIVLKGMNSLSTIRAIRARSASAEYVEQNHCSVGVTPQLASVVASNAMRKSV